MPASAKKTLPGFADRDLVAIQRAGHRFRLRHGHRVACPPDRHEPCDRASSWIASSNCSRRLDAWTMRHRITARRRRAIDGLPRARGPPDAGSMAYFSVLSIFQLVVLGVVIASFFIGEGEARELVVEQVAARVPARRRNGRRRSSTRSSIARHHHDRQLRLPAVGRARHLLRAVDRDQPRLRQRAAPSVPPGQARRPAAHGDHRPARGRLGRHRDRDRHPPGGGRRTCSPICPPAAPSCGSSACWRRSS